MPEDCEIDSILVYHRHYRPCMFYVACLAINTHNIYIYIYI